MVELSRYYKGKWAPTLRHPYSKFTGQPNRLYGERAYTDKFRVQTSSLPRENKLDYDINFKQYRYQKQENKVESGIEDKIQTDLGNIQLEILSYLKQKKNKLELNEDKPVKIEASSNTENEGGKV